MSRNEVREIASKIVDDKTVIGKPGWFVTYAVIGSGIISVMQKMKDRNQDIIKIEEGLQKLVKMTTYTVSCRGFSLKSANLRTKKLEM